MAMPERQESGPRTVLFLDEGDRTPRPMAVGEALAEALARAALANEERRDPFAVSFTTLFVGLLAGEDPVGEWLRSQVGATGVDLAALLKPRGLDPRAAESLRETSLPPDATRLPLTRSSSARTALTEAERLARDLGTVTDSRHVVAAYLSLPTYHEQDFRTLRIDRVAWAQAFSDAMARAFRSEARTWREFAARVFPRSSVQDPIPNAAQQPVAPAQEAHPEQPPAEPTPDLNQAEAHVRQGLQEAQRLAGDDPVRPFHVISAAVNLAASGVSPAFQRLAKIARLPARAPERGARSDREVALGDDLRRELAWAQRPTAGETSPHRLWGRDLVTAALLCDDPALSAALEQVGRPLDLVRDLWLAFVTREGSARSAEEWRTWWRRAGVALPGPRRTGYATETDEGQDRLGVEGEAQAFARLILDRAVQAPLSIGILGDWGSGKSFFIEQIKKQVSALKGQRPELLEEVVQIEFNAWHASDANLWASLVTFIFDEIWAEVSRKPGTEAAARDQLVQEIERARGAVHEAEVQVEAARTALSKAEGELDRKRTLLAWSTVYRKIGKDELERLAGRAGWHQPLQTINDVDRAVREVAASGNRLRLVAASLTERPFRHVVVPIAVVGAVTGALWLAPAAFPDWYRWEPLKELSRWVTTITGAVAAIVAPLRTAGRKVGELASKLTAVRDGYADELGRMKDQKEAERIREARRELDSAETSVSVAKDRLAELLTQRASLDPARRLGAFLQERVQSTLYRSQQGIISLVHRDFRELSRYMKKLREAAPAQPAPGDASPRPADEAVGDAAVRPFDRIVLYVDDLDRCRPDQVVHMLEAVHLLLALDLFVVVVAVDSRWLTRALEVHYRDLLVATDSRESDGLRASTPQNYLEKIFQVTYALGPMKPEHVAEYVASLSSSQSAEATARAASGAARPQPPGESGNAARRTPAVGGVAETPGPAGDVTPEPATVKGGPKDGGSAAQGAGTAPRPATPPPAIRIDEAEQEFICRLAPLLPTPRIAKRLANVYRLIKSMKSADELEEFEGRRSESCLLVLAILFGRPTVAADLLRALHERRAPFDDGSRRLIDAIAARAHLPGEPPHVRQAWADLLSTLKHIGVDQTVAALAGEPLEVARYSLVSGHDWHTWLREAPPRAPAGQPPRPVA